MVDEHVPNRCNHLMFLHLSTKPSQSHPSSMHTQRSCLSGRLNDAKASETDYHLRNPLPLVPRDLHSTPALPSHTRGLKTTGRRLNWGVLEPGPQDHGSLGPPRSK